VSYIDVSVASLKEGAICLHLAYSDDTEDWCQQFDISSVGFTGKISDDRLYELLLFRVGSIIVQFL